MSISKRALSLSAGVVIVAVAAGAFMLSSMEGESTELRPNDGPLISQGAEIYASSCASCHGANLEGEQDWRSGNPDGTLKAPPHDETGHTWHHADELLFRITKFGTAQALGLEDFKSNMPAFQDNLTDEEIIAVLSWIKAQWPDKIKDRHDMMNERAKDTNR